MAARILAIAVAAGGLLAGCGAPSLGMSPNTSAAGDCPPVEPGSGFAAVDFVDFVQWHGTSYLADTKHVGTLSPSEVGAVRFHVRCTFSTLNDLTHKAPPPPRDRDAGYLPAGTSVHALRGSSALCRLAARHDGKWRIYLAQRTDTDVDTAKVCSPPH